VHADDFIASRVRLFRSSKPVRHRSARLLAGLGFKAIATSSAGFAWSTGRRDNDVSLDDVLGHLRAVAGSVESGERRFQDGFATEPADVAVNVIAARQPASPACQSRTRPATRDGAARSDARRGTDCARAGRIDASGTRVLLTARSEGSSSAAGSRGDDRSAGGLRGCRRRLPFRAGAAHA